MPARPYKDYVIYGCFVLNRLVAELDIDLDQPDLESKLDTLLRDMGSSLSKEEVKREIRSNHVMTNKVVEALVKDGLVTLTQEEGRYRIAITKAGVLHIRKYNEFYRRIYQEQIRDHYRYRPPPFGLRE